MKRSLVATAVITLSSGAAAHETGTFLPHPPASAESTSKAAVRDTVRQFGRCALSKSPGFVAKVLDAPVGSPEYDRWIRRVADGECLGFTGQLRLDVPTMRGALVEASYARSFAHNGPTDFAAVAPIDYAARFGQPGNAAAERAVQMVEFGDCLARADGVNAKALVLAAPGSSAETMAIAGIKPHLTACVEKNVTMSFDRTAFRSAVAEGLYRLSQAADPRATTAKE